MGDFVTDTAGSTRDDGARSSREATFSIRAAAVRAACAALAIGAYQLLLRPINSPIDLVFIGVLLGLVAGASLLSRSVLALVVLTIGVLMAWRGFVGWLVLWPADIAVNRSDLAWIVVLTLLIVALVFAVRWRPPTRSPNGTVVLESRIVNWVALLCVLGGPVLGLVALMAFAPGDRYLRPLVLGLAVGVYGLLLLAGYSAFYAVTHRPQSAAILAAVYPPLLLVVANLAR
jgi:hypothetical protein